MRHGETRVLWAVFALALAVRLAYAFQIRDLPTLHALVMDAQRYDALARDVLDRGWRPRAAFYQAPLYPYLLAAVYAVTGRSIAAVRLLQALAGAGTAVLAAVAARRLWRPADERAAWFAGVLAALYAPAVFYTPLLLKTVPLLLLEATALVTLLPPGRDSPGDLSPRRAAAAGWLLGTAALLQESMLLLLPAAAAWLLVAGGRDRDVLPSPRPAPGPRLAVGLAAALAAGGALGLAPAALLNYAAGGELLLTSSQGGMNFYIGNARGATGTYTGLSGGSQSPEHQQADAQRLAADFAARDGGKPIDPRTLTPARVSRIFWHETWRQIAAEPAAWLRLMGRKAALFWNAYEVPDAEGFRVYRDESSVLRYDPVTFGLVAPLAAVGLLASARRNRRDALLLALLIGACCAAVTLFFIFGRYRLAVVPFLLPLAAAGVLELLALRRRLSGAAAPPGRAETAGLPEAPGTPRTPRTPRPSTILGVIAVAALIVDLPLYSAAEKSQHDAVIRYNIGTAGLRWSQQSYADFQRQVRAAPGGAPPAARQSFARAVLLAGRAAGDFDAAAGASPGFFAAELEAATARLRRGTYLAQAGQLDAALADYAAARQRVAEPLAAGAGTVEPEIRREARSLVGALDAATAETLTNLGLRRLAGGRLAQAEEALRRAVASGPDLPGPWGALALCRFQLGMAARADAGGRGGDDAAHRWLQASRDAYARATGLAAASGRGDLVALYRAGQARAEAEMARRPAL